MAHQRSLALKLRIIEDGGDYKLDMNQANNELIRLFAFSGPKRLERVIDSAGRHDLKQGMYEAWEVIYFI
ncbi:MAG: hypothetical protein JAY99_08360 [Candidatus Thiodiazotropha lotti]|uniref:Uncharacterized protein n=1 Tax=Candidatus Thiodiazotropha endoloripes TaxID=1818881 RepID=A0A1E2UN78_9GAMM|nr:hypothetical protein [Candidatus Thiodiazotropha endoloripes]MCG7897176.1 hypothetical protein [Candidatus Thiodiazotropha weberae]MCG7999524.1 hypothetical protein [Candidatus Thiodiazotropha lotti]MCG7902256.1 hypothetical protein [Candidatus Thiodiazotropha weberae]MCW4191292.1 hypothetical protein [Candidatus Thiodiazotropha weberae]ODB84309.1 hypothetical protein A3193_15990 [Candidatus Thiodiazotropha endoloripes]